ncbi:MAG: hypothetical protein ACJ76H_13955 [Bacteriovoracaceae bacterium]
MRKHGIALLGFFSGVLLYYIKAPAPVTNHDEFHQQEFVSTTMAAPKFQSPSQEDRKPAVVPVAESTADIHQEELRNLPGLPRGMKFAPFVHAVAAENYHNEMGVKLMEKNGFVFFHSENSGEANVVYDKRLDTFHPLTSTIKLTGVDGNDRQEILKKWNEYYYNEQLEVQFVQSTHEDLFKDYQELKKAGAKPQFEIVQAVYQTR